MKAKKLRSWFERCPICTLAYRAASGVYVQWEQERKKRVCPICAEELVGDGWSRVQREGKKP